MIINFLIIIQVLYENEYGNYEEAEKWYKKAVGAGDAYGYFDLGILYEKRYGNYEEAMKWYTKAYENGIVNAIDMMNNLPI